MTESEEGEWVRYEDYKEETEILRMERDSYRAMYGDTFDNYCAMTRNYYKEQSLSSDYRFRVGVLNLVLMATYGVIVAKLIVWSLGVL